MTFAPFIPRQTAKDRKRQEETVKFLSKKWNFEPEDQGEFAVIDYHCKRNGKTVAILEIKSKFCKFTDYDTYLCTCKDIDTGLSMAQEINVPFILAVRWNDFFGYLKVTHNNYRARQSGQWGRNDPNDALAMCYLIPMSEFREISEYD